jgi:K+-transporting ATPase KdpF subunit
MNVLEIVTVIATVLTFVYLLWALLRAEDF